MATSPAMEGGNNNIPFTFIINCKTLKKHRPHQEPEDEDFVMLTNSDDSCNYMDEVIVTSKEPEFCTRGFYFRSYLPLYNNIEKGESFSVLGSSNGLLLCCPTKFCMQNHSVYYVYNPFTMQCIALPPTPTKDSDTFVGFVAESRIGRENTHSNVKPISINREYSYRVVRINIFSSSKSTLRFVEIYSSENREWKSIEINLSWAQTPVISNAIPYNGKFHWLTSGNNNIITFDPHNVIQHLIRGPKLPKEERNLSPFSSCIGVCQGSMYMLQLLKPLAYTLEKGHSGKINLKQRDDIVDACAKTLVIWKLEDYSTGQWRLEHEVDLREMMSKNSILENYTNSRSFMIKAVGLHLYNKDIVYLGFHNIIASCNLKKGDFQVIANMPCRVDDFFISKNVYTLVHPRKTPVMEAKVEKLQDLKATEKSISERLKEEFIHVEATKKDQEEEEPTEKDQEEEETQTAVAFNPIMSVLLEKVLDFCICFLGREKDRE